VHFNLAIGRAIEIAATSAKLIFAGYAGEIEMRPLRDASPSRTVRPDRAFHLVARSVHGRAALAARTPCGATPPEAKGHPATRCKPLRGYTPNLKYTP